jgi:hypothetical protein
MLFLVNVCDCKFCPSLLETVGIRVLIWNCRDLFLFNAVFSVKSCPPARCASVENTIYKDDIFREQLVTLNHILK